MRNPIVFTLCCLLLLIAACNNSPSEITRPGKRILLISGENNACIQDEIRKYWQASPDNDLQLEASTDYSALEEDSISQYSSVVLLNIEEDSLNIWHHSGVERYLEAGGGLIILDSTGVTPYLWPIYEKALQKTDSVTSGFVQLNHGKGRLAVADLSKLTCQPENLRTELETQFTYTIGNNSYNYALATSPPAPKFSRYTKVVLDDDIYEPMEMAILPDCRIIFLERRGKMKLYDPYDKATRLVADFDVCIEGNYEDGLQGIAIDTKYGKENHWIYVYYSPPCDNPNQFLSRFVFKNDSLHWSSERVMLEVKVQRETCCHSGGSVEFGPDGLLYLSTGDNTSSKESDGYTPTDERPGRGPFDAQKSSGNMNDLRGKILRIKPEADGTYSIPEGNLFPADGSGGRPEIYTMGCRNPFRISIDARTNFLYWGDVGPDVGQDGRYGPQSYDEWNQARSAGNYGWPYFVADNKAYPDRNFETDEVGAEQDPTAPVNDSPNNTGGKKLPPARPAWIWYPYGESEEFPLLGTGSRSSMAGPVYYRDNLMPLTTTAFPEYYEGKLFIYEWARSWIKVLTLNEEGRLIKMEPFMPETPFVKPIEMEFGPDGALYVLEYGRQYFMNNPEAKLSRIEFAKGNRIPIPQLLVDEPAGAAPHTVNFSAAGSFDYDPGDTLSFEWQFVPGETVQATGPNVSFTFEKKGVYHPTLRVKDQNGGIDSLSTIIRVGNALPLVQIDLDGNRSFYFDPGAVKYRVRISDPEDEQQGGIDPDRVMVNMSFVKDGNYLKELASGKQHLPDGPLEYIEGLKHINESDCLSCHHQEKPNIGPSYQAVAERYKGDYLAGQYLAKKIINGGNGVWGEKIMSGHPQLSLEVAEQMAQYILSLADSKQLPLEGNFNLKSHNATTQDGGYIISAAYRDSGADELPPLTKRELLVLRHPKIEAEDCDEMKGVDKSRFGDNREFTQVGLRPGSYLVFKDIDLTKVSKVQIRMKHWKALTISLRVGSPEGKVVGQLNVSEASAGEEWQNKMLPVSKGGGSGDLYLTFEGEDNFFFNQEGEKIVVDAFWLDWLWFKK